MSAGVWKAIHTVAALTGALFLTVLGIDLFETGNVVLRGHGEETLPAAEVLLFVALFVSVTASAVRSFINEDEA